MLQIGFITTLDIDIGDRAFYNSKNVARITFFSTSTDNDGIFVYSTPTRNFTLGLGSVNFNNRDSMTIYYNSHTYKRALEPHVNATFINTANMSNYFTVVPYDDSLHIVWNGFESYESIAEDSALIESFINYVFTTINSGNINNNLFIDNKLIEILSGVSDLPLDIP